MTQAAATTPTASWSGTGSGSTRLSSGSAGRSQGSTAATPELRDRLLGDLIGDRVLQDDVAVLALQRTG
jgi:hypothetical protein